MKNFVLVFPLVLGLSQVASAISDKCLVSIVKATEMSVYYGKDRQILKTLPRGSDRYNKQIVNVNSDSDLAAAYTNHAKKVCN